MLVFGPVMYLSPGCDAQAQGIKMDGLAQPSDSVVDISSGGQGMQWFHVDAE
jgi:hypothetical protein